MPGVKERVLENRCPKIYIANIMTQPGETTGLGLADHLRILEEHAGAQFVTAVVAHDGPIPEEALAHYAEENAHPVRVGAESRPDLKLASGDIVDHSVEGATPTIRHDPEALARLVLEVFRPWSVPAL